MGDRAKKFLKGFTLTELMVVVALIGVIAAFGIPGYGKMMRKAHERNAIRSLVAINAANVVYEARTNGYYDSGGAVDLAAINTNLRTEIRPLSLTYSYNGTAAAYTATAAWGGGTPFTLRVNENPISLGANNPCCLAGTCPTRPAC